jgi:hypothetical protein
VSCARARRHASESKFAIASTTRPSGRVTRAISAIASSGRSKWSIAPLQIAASKLLDAKGSASDQPRTHFGMRPLALADTSFAQAVMRAEGSAPITSAPRAASAIESWPKPLATSRIRRPGAGSASSSVTSVMRSKSSWLSRVVPVGMTSLMSRSRSTTRMGRGT